MNLLSLGIDLVAIAVLAFGIYFLRYRRREVMVAMIGLNVAVVAVSAALASASVGLGLGLGLFGVLSIIRLRSDELAQHEVAYYFAALTLGLLGGSTGLDLVWVLGLMTAVVATLYLGDHPAIAKRTERQQIQLDRAYTDEVALRARVESLLGGNVDAITVVKTDLVNDTTLVDVRFVRAAKPAPVAAVAR